MAHAPLVLLAAVLAIASADGGIEKLVAEGHFKRALPLVQARLASDPDDAQANYLLSFIALAMDDREGALSPAERAVALQPDNSAYHVQLAESLGSIAERASVLSQIALTRRFKKEIETALALDPKNTDALFDLMKFYVRAPALFGGDMKKAHALADEIVAIDPVAGAFALVHLAKAEDRRDEIEAYSPLPSKRGRKATPHERHSRNIFSSTTRSIARTRMHARRMRSTLDARTPTSYAQRSSRADNNGARSRRSCRIARSRCPMTSAPTTASAPC
jgi:tetratricopeptide (TPR) repeat protein